MRSTPRSGSPTGAAPAARAGSRWTRHGRDVRAEDHGPSSSPRSPPARRGRTVRVASPRGCCGCKTGRSCVYCGRSLRALWRLATDLVSYWPLPAARGGRRALQEDVRAATARRRHVIFIHERVMHDDSHGAARWRLLVCRPLWSAAGVRTRRVVLEQKMSWGRGRSTCSLARARHAEALYAGQERAVTRRPIFADKKLERLRPAGAR